MKQKAEWTHPVVIYTLISMVLMFFIARPIVIPTQSMENTINDPTIVLGYNIHLTDISRGSIIGFKFIENGKKCLYIKRVIGLPGDTVQINGDTVIVNGKILKEDYLVEPMNPYELEDIADYVEYNEGESKNGLHFYDFDGNEIVWEYSSATEDNDTMIPFTKNQLYNHTFEVPDDCYFCLGDNRNYSLDSRFWEYPFVKADDVRYRIILQAYPLKVFRKEDFEWEKTY